MKQWVNVVIGVIAAVLVYFVGPHAGTLPAAYELVFILVALLFGTGIALASFAFSHRKHARQQLFPALCVAWLLVSYWFIVTNILAPFTWVAIVVSIAASLFLAYQSYFYIRAMAGSRDDDVRKGGYEVWK